MERVTVSLTPLLGPLSSTSVSRSRNATFSECIEYDERKAELPSSWGSAAARMSWWTTGEGWRRGCSTAARSTFSLVPQVPMIFSLQPGLQPAGCRLFD